MNTYFPALHGTRGVAAILVLLFHWTELFPALSARMRINIFNTEWDLALAMNVGWLGVTLFFVLSGFLIGKQLQERIITTRSILLFWNRRVSRIYPAYAFQLIVLVTLYFALGKQTIDSIGSAAAHATLWFDLPPFKAPPINGVWWSLSVEMAFYISAPLILVLTRKLEKTLTATIILAITIGWRTAIIHNYPSDDHTTNLSLLNSLPGSAFSFYCGFYVSHIKTELSNRSRFALLIASMTALYASVALLVENLDTYWKGGALLATWNSASSACIASAIYCLRKPSWFSAPLTATPCLWAGNLSYGIYLWHLPVLILSKEYIFKHSNTLLISAEALLFCIVATATLASTSYYLIEQKFHAFRKPDKKNL
jgi:peptidoglycan/LPS O-acetylase OafA/YrhL